jgi:hypothetical protein
MHFFFSQCKSPIPNILENYQPPGQLPGQMEHPAASIAYTRTQGCEPAQNPHPQPLQIDILSRPFQRSHPAVELRRQEPSIRPHNLVPLHQQAPAIRARSPAHHAVDDNAARFTAAQDNVPNPDRAAIHRAYQQAVTIFYQWLHADTACPEAQGLAVS